MTAASMLSSQIQNYDTRFECEEIDYGHEDTLDDDPSIEEDDEQICKHCGKLILEGHAYELGEDRWHINCFRCSKCSNLLGINSDFLVVGTGELVCENCFYDCQVCGKKIGDLAILAGNQPYCADCFVCKHCKNRIDNLRYAKTSSGLYCMNCHEKVLQKKKRLEQEKRARRQNQKRGSNGYGSGNSTRNTTPIYEKSLPLIPPKDASKSIPSENKIYSNEKNTSLVSFSSPFEVEDVLLDEKLSPVLPASNRHSLSSIVSKQRSLISQNSDNEYDHEFLFKKKPSYERKPSSDRNRKSVSFYELEHSGSSGSDYLKSHNHSSTINLTSQTAEYGAGHDVLLDEPPKGLSNKSSSFDLLNNESNVLDPKNGTDKARLPISNKVAANRKILYVDEFDENASIQIEDDSNFNDQETGYAEHKKGARKQKSAASLASGKYTFGENQDVGNHNHNSRIGYSDEDLVSQVKKSSDGLKQLSSSGNNTPKNSKFKFGNSPSTTSPVSNTIESTDKKVGRSLSIKSPKALLSNKNKHKRSSSAASKESSGGFQGLSLLDPKSMTSSRNVSPDADKSVFSEYASKMLDATKPLPIYDSTQSHSRSSSDILNSYASETSTIRLNEEQIKTEAELKNTKLELYTMTSKVSSLKEEVGSLTTTRDTLTIELSELTLTMQKLKFQIEKEKQALEHIKFSKAQYSANDSNENFSTEEGSHNKFGHSREALDRSNLVPYKSSSRNTSEHSIPEKDSFFPTAAHKTTPLANSSMDGNLDNLYHQNNGNVKSPLLVSTSQGFSVQPYSSSVITPTTEEITIGQVESVQAAVKPKVKARFWRSKGFAKFQNKDNEGSIGNNNNNNNSNNNTISNNGNINSNSALKISAPVLQHLDEDAFTQMNNKNKMNNNINTPTTGETKGKGMTFLDKFSSSITSSTSSNNLNNELLAGIKSPIKSASSALVAGSLNKSKTTTVSLIEKSNMENRDVPNLVLTCIKYVEKHGIHSEGIYRKSGGTSQIQQLEQAFDSLGNNETTSKELEQMLSCDINVVTSVLKRYLRRLPEPVIVYSLYEQYISCATIKRTDKKIEKIKSIVNQLPKQHRLTLNIIAKHLHLISQYSESNFMTLHNLAIVFAPSLVRDLTGEREIVDMVYKNDVTEFLVSNCRQIF